MESIVADKDVFMQFKEDSKKYSFKNHEFIVAFSWCIVHCVLCGGAGHVIANM
jgi:hypothetical protein